jgi:hypothetical protein
MLRSPTPSGAPSILVWMTSTSDELLQRLADRRDELRRLVEETAPGSGWRRPVEIDAEILAALLAQLEASRVATRRLHDEIAGTKTRIAVALARLEASLPGLQRPTS